MKTAIRHIVANTYRPLLKRYLSKTRVYRYEDITLQVPPEVFHPGFFFSTRLLLNHLRRLDLGGKSFYELGCGSGLLSIYAARQSAQVTASDINPVAIEFLRKNAGVNGVSLEILESDMFEKIPTRPFDVIAINPPYYKKQPSNYRDYAWYCGEKGEYFERLFNGLGGYMNGQSEVYIVLFEGCDMELISNISSSNGFNLFKVKRHQNLLETNFIYKIEQG